MHLKEKNMEDERYACPTQGGSFVGYEVQVKRINGQWGPAKIAESDSREAIPLPRMHRGILDTLFLLGYEQAMCIAWMIKAVGASEIKRVDVRIVPFDIVYDTKAYKKEEEAIALNDKD